MKLLFFGNTSWSMWNFRKEVLLAFKKQGHEIFVCAPKDEYSTLLEENFNYIEIKHLSRKGLNPLQDILLTYEIFKTYKYIQPDDIFQYTIKPNIYGSIAAFFCGKKPYSFITGMGYIFTNFSPVTLIVSFLYRIATSLSKKVLFLNKEDIEDFKKFHMLAKNTTKAILMPGEGVDLTYYNDSQNSPFKDKDEGIFIFVGRLLIDKGIREFLSAAREIKQKYPKTIFKVVGPLDNGNPSTITEKHLNEFIQDNSVEYVGHVMDVRPYLANCDALILPSYQEGFSRVCLEAYAMKKPVIATDDRGTRELVQNNKTGYTISKENLKNLHKVLEKFLMLTPIQRLELGEKGYKNVSEQYTIDTVIEFYKKLL